MKVRKLVFAGGMLNSIMAVFHIYLCYHIHQNFNSDPVYPLLQMLSVGGTIMVIFLACSSLLILEDLTVTKAGKSILLLNVIIYLSRIAGEYILFPRQSPVIIGVCLLISAIYLFAFYFSWHIKGEYAVH